MNSIFQNPHDSGFNISLLSNNQIFQDVSNLLDELWTRFNSRLISLKDKEEILSHMLTLKSKMFFIEASVLNKSLEPQKYTPCRVNQLSIAILIQRLPQFLNSRREFLLKFINGFWTSCKCKEMCFFSSRV